MNLNYSNRTSKTMTNKPDYFYMPCTRNPKLMDIFLKVGGYTKLIFCSTTMEIGDINH